MRGREIERDRTMEGLKEMKRWMEMQDIEMVGGHFLLAPSGWEVDGKDWVLIHGETMTTCNEFTLDEGDTVADLAAHLREAMPGALVSPPSVVGRINVSASNSVLDRNDPPNEATQ